MVKSVSATLILTLVAKVFEPELPASVDLSLAEAYDEAYRIVEYGLLPRGERVVRGASRSDR